ncbi:MAG: polyribonucleotide nucleotidyltransferase [Candidatus Uhrbacteria bacterium]|nr:polyribonucleotide nucleotidyltransferase [Candidatus Uhrbacteria bacterium]
MEAQKEYSIELAGRTLTIGTGLLAQQANASCTVRYGDTVVLCAATMGGERAGIDFLPLQVEYEERMYAAGRIKGSRFIKREGRPTDEAVLSGRLIDRAVRPLFDESIRREIQVVATVLSHDQENDGDIPGLIGASCALMMSDIPWNGPIAAIRIGQKDGKLIVMPTYAEIEEGTLDLVVAGTRDKTLMVEAGATEVPESVMLEAMKLAHANLDPVIELINKVAKDNVVAKWDPTSALSDEEKTERARIADLRKRAETIVRELAPSVMWSQLLVTKADRKNAQSKLKEQLIAKLEGVNADDKKKIGEWIKELVNGEVTRAILEEGKRVDGRAITQIRPLTSMIGLLPRTHGSGLFNRGETQVLSTVTLGAPSMEQTIDTMEYQTKRRYFHHYNFPGYSVGEAKPNRGPGRREIGHGALAERALLAVLPNKETFPYTIRVVSEVLGSNGSSSMASTCGSTLALMDAGVPITAPVAGIAMGIALDDATGKFRVITDIQDLEDGKGGMDFKITGTRNGITAVQMDTKTLGLPWAAVEQTIAQSRDARMEILQVIEKTIPAPRPELSKWAPRIESFFINPEKIREVIGPGGKVINEIIAETKVEIDIEDSGLVMVTSVSAENMKRAVDWIKQIVREVEVGEVFSGKVTRIMDFGAFVEILPKQEGLVHISELAPERVPTVGDVVKVGDTVNVKVIEIDAMGRVNLSMKRARPDYVDNGEPLPSRERRSGGAPHHGGGGRDRRPPFRR